MKKADLIKSAMKGRSLAINKAPFLLATTAIIGVGVTIYNCIQDTKEYEKRFKNHKFDFKKNPGDIFEIGKVYSSTIVSGSITVFSMVFSHMLSAKRQAALMGAYTLLDKTSKDYRNKVKEVIGDKKEKEIGNAISQDKIIDTPKNFPIKSQYDTGFPVYDSITGNQFYATVAQIKELEARHNREIEIFNQPYVSLNDLFSEIPSYKCIPIGNDIGWDIEHPIDIAIGTHLNDLDQPCLSIRYNWCVLKESMY